MAGCVRVGIGELANARSDDHRRPPDRLQVAGHRGLTMERSTVTDNETNPANGGGIYAEGVTRIVDSTAS